jgi:PAS domain S-box-containing protein
MRPGVLSTPIDPMAFDQLADLCGDLLCLCQNGAVTWINGGGARLLGRPVTELAGTPFSALVHPDHRPKLRKGLDVLADGGSGHPMLLSTADDSVRTVLVLARDLGDGTFAIAARDLATQSPSMDSLVKAISRLEERARELTRLSRRNDLSAQVFQTASEGIMVLGRDLRIATVNPAFTQITGWLSSEVIGRKPPQLTEGGQDHQAGLLMYEAARSSGRWQGEQWNLRRDGERYAERVGISTIHDDHGELQQYVVVFSDITQRKLDEERIRKQANYDALTSLPNRALFLDRLGQSVSQAERNGQMVGLMFIDLDGFKLVNDTLGHDMGDLLLQEAGGGCPDASARAIPWPAWAVTNSPS